MLCVPVYFEIGYDIEQREFESCSFRLYPFSYRIKPKIEADKKSDRQSDQKEQKTTKMKKIGIWLDQKEANIITISDDKQELKTIYSEIETRERFPGEGKKYGRFGDQHLNDEKSKKLRGKKESFS